MSGFEGAGKPRLMVVIASTRPGRVGEAVGRWFAEAARADGRFDVDLVDLADIALPFMDEPNHPRLRQYTHDHTKAWSARVDAADAVVLVMPEYNHGYTAPLKNAIDYLHQEWQHKPVGFVSYGGVSAGLRAVQSLKPILLALKMTPLVESVPLPFVHRSIDEEGAFVPPEGVEAAATGMLAEMARMVGTLRPLRAPVAAG